MSYEQIRNNLLSMNSDGRINAIMVVSSVEGEGTTTVASNLSRALAKDRSLRVLLVDANYSNPSIRQGTGTGGPKGFSDLLSDAAVLKDCLCAGDPGNPSVVASGQGGEATEELFKYGRVRSAIDALKKEFDYVIIDSAPMSSPNSSLVLASQVDGVVLVVQSLKTRREVVGKAREDLEKASANILGVVLNRRRYVIPEMFYRKLP